MPYGSGPHFPPEVGFGSATCHTAPNLASLPRLALALPRVIRLRTSPLDSGGLRRCHVPYGSEPHLLTKVGSGIVTCPMTLDPASLLAGLQVTTCHAVPYGPRASSIKKILAGLPLQLGLHVPNAHVHISKAPDARAIMGLQDVRACSAVNACKMCKYVATVRL
jgi:hypothetical protein